jgi:hypothetical protein
MDKIMAKLRSVNTSIWVDDFIVELDPIEKLLFMYLLINPFTRLSGCYKLTIRQIAFDTGINSDMVLKILGRFETQKKVIYKDGWIFLPNFLKNQNLNENMRKNVASELVDAPEWAKSMLATIIESSETLRKAFKGFETLRNASKREVEVEVEVKREVEVESECEKERECEAEKAAHENAIAFVENHSFEYPLKELVEAFPNVQFTSAQCGAVEAQVRIGDEAAWLATIQIYQQNYDPFKKRYLPDKIGNLLSVFESQKQKLEIKNGTNQPNKPATEREKSAQRGANQAALADELIRVGLEKRRLAAEAEAGRSLPGNCHAIGSQIGGIIGDAVAHGNGSGKSFADVG